MTYNAIAAAAQDADLRLRVAACFAQEAADSPHHPTTLAEMHMWDIAARSDISDAYSYAVALGEIDRPGHDEAVVTDLMILSAVQALLASPTPEAG
jgi:hypothetical protein